MVRITTHPGEILKEDFLLPLGLSARALAEAIDVPANRITSIINGTRSVTAETAIKLGHHFGTTPELWMNLQQAHDLSTAIAALKKKPGHVPATRRHQAKTPRRRSVAAA